VRKVRSSRSIEIGKHVRVNRYEEQFVIALYQALVTFQQAPEQAAPNPLLAFMPFILIILVFYLLILRPQSKRQKQHMTMVKGLQKGDRVVTAGGFHGTIQGVNDEEDTVVLEIADRVRVTVGRPSISQVKGQKG
jgi:preprotein translocase subunit YajC